MEQHDPADRREPVEDGDAVEFESEVLGRRDEEEADGGVEGGVVPTIDDGLTAPTDPSALADADAAVDAFVELVNARDLDALEEVLAEELDAPFFATTFPEGLVEGLGDLLHRYPTLVLTRGALGPEPIAAAWMFDLDQDRYDLTGYFVVATDGSEEDRIDRLDYVEVPTDPDQLIAEAPDRSELAEWEDWNTQDAGEI